MRQARTKHASSTHQARTKHASSTRQACAKHASSMGQTCIQYSSHKRIHPIQLQLFIRCISRVGGLVEITRWIKVQCPSTELKLHRRCIYGNQKEFFAISMALSFQHYKCANLTALDFYIQSYKSFSNVHVVVVY